MKTFNTTIKFESLKSMNFSEQKRFEEILYTIKGINFLSINSTSITLDFYEQLVDETYIKKMLVRAGFSFKEKSVKHFFGRFINKLAKENKKTYGGKKLDCCDLND